MRTKEERKILHTSNLKLKQNDTQLDKSRTGIREEIVQMNGKTYKKIKVDHQPYFVEMKIEKE